MCKHSLRLIIQRIDGGISDFWSGLLMDANIQSEHRLWIEYFHDDRNADRSSRSEYSAVNASLSSAPCDGRDWEPIYTDFSFQMRQTFMMEDISRWSLHLYLLDYMPIILLQPRYRLIYFADSK